MVVADQHEGAVAAGVSIVEEGVGEVGIAAVAAKVAMVAAD